MSSSMPLNPLATVHIRRYFLLLEVLQHERAAEPHLDMSSPGTWLVWGHGVRWLLVRMPPLVPSAA